MSIYYLGSGYLKVNPYPFLELKPKPYFIPDLKADPDPDPGHFKPNANFDLTSTSLKYRTVFLMLLTVLL